VLWRVFATNFGVVPVAVVEPVLIAALAVGVLAGANLLAASPRCWPRDHSRPGCSGRSEPLVRGAKGAGSSLGAGRYRPQGPNGRMMAAIPAGRRTSGRQSMKTRAAVLRDVGKDWEVIEMDLDPPKEGEVLIRFAAAGLCHSDDHLRTGDIPVRYPIVGGHEGAGVIEEVGAGVTRLKPGDHIVCSFLPTCGHCRFCAQGMTNLCDLGALFVDNCLPDGTFRFHADGEDFGQMCLLGTFSERSVVSEHSCIKIDDDLPLETVALVSCGVPTGWGTAVNAGGVRPATRP
jgi:Zn-dependent alcohol dehydrogenases, class III